MQPRLPLAGIDNDVSHTINLSLLSYFGTNQEDVSDEEQPKIKPRLESENEFEKENSLSIPILRSLPFSGLVFFWIRVFESFDVCESQNFEGFKVPKEYTLRI